MGILIALFFYLLYVGSLYTTMSEANVQLLEDAGNAEDVQTKNRLELTVKNNTKLFWYGIIPVIGLFIFLYVLTLKNREV